MGRKFQDKTHVGRRVQRQKNGDVYVLERTTKYDPVTKKTRTIAQRLIGKIPAGGTEMVPTRPKRPAAKEPAKDVRSVRLHTGVTDILDFIGRDSGIDEDIRSAFPQKGVADKILSVARYWLATGGQTLPRMASWQAMHETPYAFTMSDDVIGDLFRGIGRDEEGVQRYFRARAGRLGRDAVIAYDSTTVSSYSANQHEARRGFNKDGDGLDTVKLLTLFAVREGEPIAFAKQPGNVPDVISISNALTQLESLGVPKPLTVTDNGYYSESNMAEFASRNMKFLTLADTDVKWVREAIDELQDELDGADGVCPFDTDVCGASKTIERHVFTRPRRRARGDKAVGALERFERRIYVHVFRSPDARSKRESAFNRRLYTVKVQLENGEELTESARRWADRYMSVSRQGRGGRPKVSFKNEAIREARKYFGYFALVTNQAMGTFTALENYRLREKIEEHFGMDKRYFDGRRTRLWHPDALRGRQLVQFVGLCYRSRLMRKIREIKNTLCDKSETKTKEQEKLERNLLGWIRSRSLTDIFDWFDCIETTTVRTEAGKFRWSTESVKRDQLFLEKLGLTRQS